MGYSVDLSSDGSILAIGAHKFNGDGDNKYLGQVKVFKSIENSWVQIGQDIVGANNNDHAGAAVSLSADGSIVAVGSYGNDDNGDDSGHVRIFKNNNDSWEQIGNDINGASIGDNFGKFLSLSDDGSFIVVGAPYNSDNGSFAGQVRVFQNNNGSWELIGSSIEGEAADDIFGSSTAISITEDDKVVLAVGAPQNDGNGSNSGHVRVYKFDEFDPTLRESNPSPGQKDISVTPDISLLFSEYIDVGNGNIYIKKSTDDSLLETIDVSGAQVSGAGTKTILIDTENKLESSTQYYIQIDESAFQDLAGNSYLGINDKTSLSFTTADVTPPTLSSSNPLDNDVEIGVSNNIELTFSEAVDVESGDIEIRKSTDDSLVENIDVTSSQVTGSGTNVITINPTNDFESATQYYLQIDASAFDDTSGNSFAGINDKTSLSFTTADVVSPILSSSNPADNATKVGVDNNIELTFSEPVDAESGDIEIRKSSDNSLVEKIDVTSSQVTGSGTNVITINPTNLNKYYYRLIISF